MSNADDPRMRGFRRRAEVADVLKLLEERVTAPEPTDVELPADFDLVSDGKAILVEPVKASIDVPHFDRSAMDGYAVRGEDTFGAGELAPVTLRIVGRSLPGSAAAVPVQKGEAVRIMTGAPMPRGADAVLMAEDARPEGDVVHVTSAVPPGKNVSRRGEDVRAGEVILDAGRRLRPQDLGVLSSVGASRIRIAGAPGVHIFCTGNELLPPFSMPVEWRIADANRPMLAALVERDGGLPLTYAALPDDPKAIRTTLAECQYDVILISGGSSVGEEDHVPGIVAELGELPIHGVAMRPSSPTGVGFIGGRPVFLLPGNPVSCLCAYDFFAGPTIRFLAGRSRDWPYRRVELPLARKITSEAGRVDYARVRVVDGKVEPLMVSGAGILSSTTRADGFVIVPRDAEGIPEGATVTVYLYA